MLSISEQEFCILYFISTSSKQNLKKRKGTTKKNSEAKKSWRKKYWFFLWPEFLKWFFGSGLRLFKKKMYYKAFFFLKRLLNFCKLFIGLTNLIVLIESNHMMVPLKNCESHFFFRSSTKVIDQIKVVKDKH